jgi:multiple sugar transport system substrate-binding protein
LRAVRARGYLLDDVHFRRRVAGPRLRGAVVAIAAGLALAWLGVGCAPSEAPGPPVLHWYVFREPSGAFDAAVARCNERASGRHRIEVATLPSGADQQREQLVRRLAARDPDIDVIGMDVIWTAEFATAGWLRVWEGPQADAVRRGTLAVAIDSGSYGGQLLAAPFTTNAQLLWYRSDLVESPPPTVDAMIAAGERLADAGLPHEIMVQAARYEGLTVWFNTLLASAGGEILDGNGELALPAAPTLRAIDAMRALARSRAAPPELASLREDDARLAFESGRAAFMLNYPFVWPSAQRNAPELARKLAFARWPRVDPGLPSRVTIGGLNLGVGAYSKHPEQAFLAAACLASDASQLLAATRGGLFPTREVLYDDPGVRAAFPFAELMRETLRDAAIRPRTPAYHDLSLAVQRSLHPPAELDPEVAAAALREGIARALESRGLL